MIQLGILGFGFAGCMHMAAAHKTELARVAAVSGRRVAEHGIAGVAGGNLALGGDVNLDGVSVYRHPEELLQDPEVDAVVITLPTHLHKTYALQAMEAGKHILCEKPLALTLDEASSIGGAAQEYGKVFMVAHCVRFWPAYARTREIIQRGELGAVMRARFTRLSPRPGWSADDWMLDPERSGGAVLDLHVHDVDFVRDALGTPDDVQAIGYRFARGGVLHADATFTYAGGAVVQVESGWMYPAGYPFRMAFEVALEGGTLEFNSLLGPELHLYRRSGETGEVRLPSADGFEMQHRYFYECIASGAPPVRSDAASACATMRLLERERRAMRVVDCSQNGNGGAPGAAEESDDDDGH